MSRYENLYLISPETFFAAIQKDLDEIGTRQKSLEEHFREVKELAVTLAKDGIKNHTAHSNSRITRWRWDARFPNYMLENLYHLENSGEIAKRWVGPNRFLEFALPLDRSTQHELLIKVIDFRVEGMEEGLILRVNDEELPWLSIDLGDYIAVIPEDERVEATARTQVQIGLRENIPTVLGDNDDRILWFSLAQIDVQRL